jgi:hypothetical protein
MADNEGKIKGTIYDIQSKTIPGKKDPTAVYNRYVFTIEVAGKYPTTPELEYFGTNDLSSYGIGDLVEIDYELRGKPLETKEGKKYMRTTPTIVKMQFGDLNTKAKHVKHVDISNIDYGKMMVEVDAPEIPMMDDSNMDNLPF